MTDGTRFTLRQLPLPAKLVLTAFLLAVGLGYTSAMVQLHLKHSDKDGEALPTVANVVERFSGLREPGPDDPPPVSRVQALLTGDPAEPDVGKENMTPAFFAKSKGYAKETAARGKAVVDRERAGELAAVVAWCAADPTERKAAYETDRFRLPTDWTGETVTAAYVAEAGAVKIQSLIADRCQTCHKDQAPSLGSYAELLPHITPPSRDLVDGKWVRSNKQISVEALTQSTHAHLLSFAVLFTLTGLVFAFTSYPGIIRGIVAPVVLVAQVADIACWWLARLDGYGPYFATTIVLTGGIVGTGLMLQIVLGLLDLYGWRGKLVLVGLFLLGAVGAGVLAKRVVIPALEAERAAATARAEPKPKEPEPTNGVVNPVKEKEPSWLERLVMGPVTGAPWSGKGSMAAAFFHKDKDKYDDAEGYEDFIQRRPKAEVDAERDGERLAVRHWIRLPDTERRKAYEADRVQLPADRIGQPITPKYLADDRTAKVKSILTDRCVRCHGPAGDQMDYPLDSYEGLLKYLEEKPADARATIPTAGD